MIVNGIYGGFIFIIPGVSVSCHIDLILARRAAKQLQPS
jgi:hypothetical protein